MFFKIFLQCILVSLVCAISKHPILIVVSYDAFRYDFFDTKLVPNMERLKIVGTYADYLFNVFPTKTFPNHHSIATGLYPETHGVIANKYYNPVTDKDVPISYEMFHYSDHVIPIWRWNEDLGDDRHSGGMMWPGSDYPYQGKNITFIQKYDVTMDWFKRVDTIISWIRDPHEPANLVMLYFEEPDTHGHAFGPNSPVVHQLLSKLDNVTLYLEQQLEKYGLTDSVNVIHLSDHGLVAVTPPHFINVTQYLTPDTYHSSGSSPCTQYFPKEGHEEDVYNRLQAGSVKDGHFKVYKKGEYLERWHYENNPRTPPILVMADVGYALDDLIIAAPKYAQHYGFNLTNSSEFGVHGYDYDVPDMHPFFMARGPKIKKHHKVAPFKTVDLFNLFCEILDITPTHNNGTSSNIKDVLLHHNEEYSIGSILIITVGGVLIALTFISVAAIITLVMIKRQQSITTTAALNKRFPQTFQASVEAQHLLEPDEA